MHVKSTTLNKEEDMCILYSSQLFVYLDIQNDTDYTSCATVTVVEGEDKNGTCIGKLRHCHTDITQCIHVCVTTHSHMPTK